VKVSEVYCVEYIGSMPHPGPLWVQRHRRPTDIYPDAAAIAAEHDTVAVNERGEVVVRSTFLHIETDEQIVGSAPMMTSEQAHVVLTALRPLLLGADPLAGERLWDIAYRSQAHGRTGIGMQALSAVDCALWDIRGQYFEVPAHVLLGGPTRDEVPAYVSVLGESQDLAHVEQRTREIREAGFGGVKWFPRPGPDGRGTAVDRVVELVAAARRGGGPGFDIMLDAWGSWDIPFTAAVARATESLGVHWIEEPLPADDIAGLRSLRSLVDGRTQLAAGEHEYTRWGISRLLRDDPLDIYQPDPRWAGGISEVVRISTLVSAAGRKMVPHGYSLAANAAVTFAASPALVPAMEYIHRSALMYQHFLLHPVRPVDGRIPAPVAPGLGTALATDRILDRRPVTATA
jgi:L-rhamnonate dehydratase